MPVGAKAFALSGSNLISFNTATPTAGTTITIAGVVVGETLVGIDIRPQNGVLYGLGVNATANTATLYAISMETGQAAVVGTAGQIAFVDAGAAAVDLPDPATVGYGIDFNPAVDRLRVTTDTGLNFRINPNTGAAIDGDQGGAAGSVAGLNTDGAINGGTTTVDAIAYSNDQPNNGGITTIYALDSATNKLFIQNPPNSGTETAGVTVTLGGATLDFSSVTGFDIPSGVNAAASNAAVASGAGFATLNVAGIESLYSIDLVTGAAALVGNVLNGSTPVTGLAIQSDLGGTPAIALTADGLNLVRFNTATPGTTTTVAVAGVTAGEHIVGIDFRPQTGQLYAVGINATANNGSLYLVDPQTGVLTHIGGAGTIAFVDGAAAAVDLPDPATSGYGIDFNPVTDRIRITTDTGLNFRVNPVTGAPVDGDQGGAAGSVTGINTDGIISGLPLGSTGVSGTAYTNSYGQALGSGVTTLYTLDATSNKLFIQNPANAGTETNGVTVTLNGAPLDFGSVNGFDIPPDVHAASSGAQAAGFGYAALTVGGVAGLYQIDLTTGVATSLGVIGLGATQLAGLTLANAHVNLAPTAVALSSASVQEFATNGTVVGAFSTVDPNVADTHTYSLIDNAGGRFGISGNNLVVTDKLLLDFEQAKSHTVTVRSTDSFGKFIDKVLTINVSDVNPETIVGDVRDNIFVGGALKDVFDGAGGNDRLTGGLGRDTLTGGAGSDTFDFNAIAESGKKASTRDVITDFKHKTDHIDLKDIDANSKKPGDQAFKFIGTADFHHVKGELHYVKIDNPGTKHDMTIVSGDTNGDGRADFQIELSHLVTLTKVDFIL